MKHTDAQRVVAHAWQALNCNGFNELRDADSIDVEWIGPALWSVIGAAMGGRPDGTDAPTVAEVEAFCGLRLERAGGAQ